MSDQISQLMQQADPIIIDAMLLTMIVTLTIIATALIFAGLVARCKWSDNDQDGLGT